MGMMKRLATCRLWEPGFGGKAEEIAVADAAMTAFLELVDADLSEVREIPPDRRGLPAGAITVGAEVEANRRSVVYFGKHKEKLLQDVPTNYLRWAVQISDSSKRWRKFQAQARMELKRRGERPGRSSRH